MSRLRLSLACALLTVGSLSACAPSPVPTTTPTPNSTCSSVGLGIAAGAPLNGLSQNDLDAELTAMKNAGATWLRFDVDWSAVESTKGQQNWSATDRVVDRARLQGLSVLGIVTYTPAWARVAGVSDTHGYPSDPAAFAKFAQQAAQRYSNRISTWEIWNEPNLTQFFRPKPNVNTYTALLKAASASIRAVQPGAKILNGGLAPAVDNGSDISPVTYLKGMYAAGAKSSFDVFSIHPYSWPALPSDSSTQNWNTFYRIRLMRESMVQNGDSGKKVWATEFGAPTGTGPTAVSPQLQANIISDGFAQAKVLGYIERIFIYSMRDRGTNTSDIEQNFGLVTINYTPKPALAAVKQAVGGCGTPKI
ncbi:cellulase family glycosylhydrolase [Rhodococcus erythropolis]|uniref:cellulase family glycosylhydrolase n=1 Tax=Rhodococcus erythropolis TaxID=1833 RepID=UPI000680B6DC|nr:cellulase family glycosylhydrolase [Rhodococcus erythropolis]